VRPRTRVIHQRSLVEGIVRVAAEEEADLIVIANPGAETEGSPMGNIMEELLKRAPCEVLVDRGDPVEAVEV
jgi:nucleotide-binding universal stress UspA family protein